MCMWASGIELDFEIILIFKSAIVRAYVYQSYLRFGIYHVLNTWCSFEINQIIHLVLCDVCKIQRNIVNSNKKQQQEDRNDTQRIEAQPNQTNARTWAPITLKWYLTFYAPNFFCLLHYFTAYGFFVCFVLNCFWFCYMNFKYFRLKKYVWSVLNNSISFVILLWTSGC